MCVMPSAIQMTSGSSIDGQYSEPSFTKTLGQATRVAPRLTGQRALTVCCPHSTYMEKDLEDWVKRRAFVKSALLTAGLASAPALVSEGQTIPEETSQE